MWNWIEAAAELSRDGVRFVMVTVASVIGSVPREVGAKMIVLEDGSILGTIGGGGLEKHAIAEAVRFLAEGGQHVVRLPLTPEHGHACGGTVEVLFEVMHRASHVYVFGVGHVGQAVCRTLDGTSFAVHAVDSRPEWINSPALPSSTRKHCCEWNEFISTNTWTNEETYVVILTWSHEIDFEILREVLKKPHAYIGVIGSIRKWDAFRKKLAAVGFSDEELQKVRCPVGLPLGGKLPQEVAISIASEILQISQPAKKR
jgi:xanthine dehydrogenase accessory factor